MKKILIVNGSKRRKGNSYALEARIAELEGKLAELADRLAEYGRQPKGQPAHEAVKKAYSGDRADSFGKALKYARK